MKLYFIIILIIMASPVKSQTYLLKKDLIERDRKDFLGCIKEVFDTEESISFNLGTGDLKSSLIEIENDTPVSTEYLDKLKDSLSRNPSDFKLLMEIGEYYYNIEDKNNSKKYYSRALEHLEASHSDEDLASFYCNRSIIKSKLGIQGFVEDAEKALSLNPNEVTTLSFYPMYLISKREFDKAKTFLENSLVEDRPVPESSIMFLALINLLEHSEEIYKAYNDPGLNEEFKQTHYEELIDWSSVRIYLPKLKDGQTRENLERLLNFYNLLAKVLFSDKNEKGQIIFTFSQIEIKQIKELKSWLISSLDNKTLNKYTAYKCLGIISFCLGDEENAIVYYQKALHSFPKNKPKTVFNPDEAYAILLFFYRQFGKNTDYENLLLKKISGARIKNISDYINLSKFYITEDQIEKARFYINEAEKINSENFDVCRLKAHLGYIEGTEIIREGLYMNKAFRFIKDDDDAYRFYLQSAIYHMLNEDPKEAFNNLITIKENRENCETCDRLLTEYFKIE
ncbi:hypothetical protein NE848_08255 [Gramella jeungdoensis]|uniref:Tetratricopeptide repeat protein n=1 Tax=Gramella jeungdoensis TaxID=708091 RepID=A0ABT0Z1V1_9FLAO|nr:hypothetical protein [Gramella jeungdoensis]MCM8569368.1 hypothetical protein [Gramella jeungdoensis]